MAGRAAPPADPTTWDSPREVRGYLRPHRVLDANDSYAGEVTHDLTLVVPVGLLGGREVPVGNADGAEAITSHRFNDLLHHIIPVPRAKATQFAITVQGVGAPRSGAEPEGLRQRSKWSKRGLLGGAAGTRESLLAHTVHILLRGGRCAACERLSSAPLPPVPVLSRASACDLTWEQACCKVTMRSHWSGVSSVTGILMT